MVTWKKEVEGTLRRALLKPIRVRITSSRLGLQCGIGAVAHGVAAAAHVDGEGNKAGDDVLGAGQGGNAPDRGDEVENIVVSRCSMCHAADPVWLGITRPPRGLMLDTAERIKAHVRGIAVTAAWSSAMPPSNATGMTPEERQIVAAWATFGSR